MKRVNDNEFDDLFKNKLHDAEFDSGYMEDDWDNPRSESRVARAAVIPNSKSGAGSKRWDTSPSCSKKKWRFTNSPFQAQAVGVGTHGSALGIYTNLIS